MRREAAGTDSCALACEVGVALTPPLVLEDVLGAVARSIAEVVGVWECDLYEYYPASRTIVAPAAWSRELSAADLEWVGTAASSGERPSYIPVLLDGESTESCADVEASVDAADRASIAAGELPCDGLVRRADKALYVAKRAGKNRVELYA